MSLAVSLLARVSLVGVCAWLTACGGAAPQKQAEPPPAPAASPAPPFAPPPTASAPPAEQPPAAPVESAGFAEAIAALRPAAALPALAALEQAPQSAKSYADAAIAYAATDAPVMTLIWGMTHQAMGGGKAEAEVAKAFTRVLTERVTVGKDDAGRTEYRVRLAPGQMPVRQRPDGTVEAPLAHAFEGLFGTTLMSFHPPWTIEEFYDVLSSWVALVSTHGTPLDAQLELDHWLVGLAKAGHLEAFCYRLLGSSFPTEMRQYRASHAKELKALDEYSKSSAFEPSRAVLPDDLVRLK
jgi:hypothetical protein